MTALRCQVCEMVWLTALAETASLANGGHGCLMCDGELATISAGQLQAHLDRLAEGRPNPGSAA